MRHFLCNRAKTAAIGPALGLLGLTAIRRQATHHLRHAGMILMFHHVAPPRPGRLEINKALEVTPETLERVLSSLKAQNHDIVPMDEVPDRLATGARAKRRFAALTFDDGCRDNLVHAVPLLVRNKAPFTIYVTTGFASGQTTPWWIVIERATQSAKFLTIETTSGLQCFDTSTRLKKERAADALHHILWRASETCRAQQTLALASQAGLDMTALTHEIYMDWTELSEIARLPECTIGAHTKTHPKLADLDDVAAMHEIWEARDIIRERLRVDAKHFAYPYGIVGSCHQREFDMARAARYVTSVTTQRDVLNLSDINRLHSLPRVQISGRYQHPAMINALVSGLPIVLAAQAKAMGLTSVRP